LSDSGQRKREAAPADGHFHSKRLRLGQEVSIGANQAEPHSLGEVISQEANVIEAVEPNIGVNITSQTIDSDGSFKENPYTILRSDDPVLRSCIERLNLTTHFPVSNVLVRNPAGEPARSLYLVNDIVKSIIENNDFKRVRLTTAGTKVMAKQDPGKGSEAQFRVLGEGLPVILPFIEPSTIIVSDLTSLHVLLSTHYPLISAFNEPFCGTMQNCAMGSHILKFPPSSAEGCRLAQELVLPIWKSNVSLTLMIDKRAKSALSLRLFGRDITETRKHT